jgi:hypothetical protein
MTSEGLAKMFEGDPAEMCDRKFPLMLMGECANGQVCADGEQGFTFYLIIQKKNSILFLMNSTIILCTFALKPCALDCSFAYFKP